MKTKSLFLIILMIAFVGCSKEEDETDQECVSGCTTISGHIVTSGNTPLKGVKLQVRYIKSQYLAGSQSGLKREVTTDTSGYYNMSFNLKDDEVQYYDAQISSYFQIGFDSGTLDPDKYFLSYYSVNNENSNMLTTRPSLKQNTSYNVSGYFPEKDYITVNLNNFTSTHEDSHFEVRTFFPWGLESEEQNEDKLLDTKYGISSSGYDHFVAKKENQVFRVPVARKDTNIVRVLKIKNGIVSSEDYKIFVDENNTIELTYDY
ncbi:MAG TPA: hypothetical protein VLZ33_06110 [Dysgonamonadaceae bacterium]|nr:hypothetical protein [Dysgonamonadaceae bacterium]